MEKTITEMVRNILPEQKISSKELDFLTPEELEACVRAAIKAAIRAKEVRIAEEEYWDKINNPVLPPANAEWLKAYFMEIYKIQNGVEFVSDDFSEPILNKSIEHFLEKASDDKANPERGMLLYGKIGAGKSSILKALCQNPFAPMKFISCRKICEQYAAGGFELISRYMTGNWIFDEFGDEPEASSYGNKVDVMVNILENNYNNRNFRQYITTNMTAKDIKSRYGERIWSRMNEMFEFVRFDKDAPDRRITSKQSI